MKQTAGSVRCLCRAAGPSRQQTARYFASSSHIPRIAPLPHRSVLEISGPDAQKFLKGLSSKDVEALGGGYSGFLNASGRVVHGSFIIPVAKAKVPTYYIIHDSPSDHPQPLEQLLPPFKLRSKVKIRDVSAEWDVWASFDYPDATHRQPVRKWKLGSGGAAESQWSWGDEGVLDLGLAENEFGCWDLRAGFGQGKLGRQLLTSKGDKPSLSSHYDSVDVNAYHLRRMVLGVPEGFREIVPGVALPLESDMDIQGGVDFRKGCYLGQELTVRTYHTGATRKRILSLSLENPSDRSATPKFSREILEGGLDLIYHPPASSASKKARSAGRLLSLHPVASNIGLGLIRLEMAEKSCWSLGPPEDTGRLSVELDGQSWDVVAEKGESLASAEEEARSISHSR